MRIILLVKMMMYMRQELETDLTPHTQEPSKVRLVGAAKILVSFPALMLLMVPRKQDCLIRVEQLQSQIIRTRMITMHLDLIMLPILWILM